MYAVQVGPSLGSFSLSAALLKALLAEFAPEITARAAKMDSDPHFWMPMTLTAEAYESVPPQTLNPEPCALNPKP